MHDRHGYGASKPFGLHALAASATFIWVLILPGSIHLSFAQESPSPSREQEMERLSDLAARMGTDPTAIIGRAQTLFRYDALEGGKRTNNLVARLDVPYKDFLLRVDMPYIWTDPNRPGVGSENGLSDLFVRSGGRVYTDPRNALFVGMDFTFPTAENAQVGSGKYTVGPGVATAHVFPRLSSLVFTLLQHQMSVGGDPSRQAVSISNLQIFLTRFGRTDGGPGLRQSRKWIGNGRQQTA